MSWYESALAHMSMIYLNQIKLGETNKVEIGKVIDANYPFGERKMYPYKAWLKARKEFFSRHGLYKKMPEKPDSLFYIKKYHSKKHLKD